MTLDEELDVNALAAALGMPLADVVSRYEAYLDGINSGTIPKLGSINYTHWTLRRLCV